MRRRDFLERGALVVGGLGAARILAACGGGASTQSASPGNLGELQAAIRGRVVLPQSPGYRRARLVWNRRFDDARPKAVVEVADAQDVRTAVDFARDHDLRPIPRSGSHSFGGYSTGDGLVIDVSGLSSARVDHTGDRVTIGAGATMLPTYRALWPQRVAISGGTCPTVGLAGLTAGGGLGVLSRRYGLTCDRLLEVEIVTADGRLLRANEHENDDLYWATRGGGGGNFGVITAMTFGPVPVGNTAFTNAEYQFPWRAVERVLAAWQDWLPTSPLGAWSAVELETQDPRAGSEPTVAIVVVNAGSGHETDVVVHDLLAAVGTEPAARDTHTGPFVDIEHDFYCKGLRPKECTLADKSPAGEFPLSALYSKSDVASGPWPRAGLRTLAEWMERRQRDRTLTPKRFSAAHTIGKVLIEAADGAVNDIAPDATAFVHRDNLFVAQYQARWHGDAPPDVVAANLDWADGLYAAVEPYRSGFAYQDYIDPGLPEWEHAYYGANLPRLREVKSKYDPDNFFRFAQSIPLA